MRHLPKNHFDFKARGFCEFSDGIEDEIYSASGIRGNYCFESWEKYDKFVDLLEEQGDWSFYVDFVGVSDGDGIRAEIIIKRRLV